MGQVDRQPNFSFLNDHRLDLAAFVNVRGEVSVGGMEILFCIY